MSETSLYRILDANINRAAEGCRTLEDLARFQLEDAALTRSLRELRHAVRTHCDHLLPLLLAGRNAIADLGLPLSQTAGGDAREDLQQLTAGAAKRMQEALRVSEENLKLLGHYPLAKEYEQLRYRAYTLEQEFRAALQRRILRPRLPNGLYGITAHELSNGRDNMTVARAMLDGGLRILQYREKDMKKRQQYEECLELRRLTHEYDALFIINDHPDIALAVEADGVHIGQDDLPLEEVRRLVGERMLIGLSTHSPAQAEDAVRRGADYIGVGPLFATKTKKDVCAPVGFEYLDYVAAKIPLPFVAIGGIKEHNLPQVLQHGATCACLVSDIVGADDIAAKVEALLKLWPK